MDQDRLKRVANFRLELSVQETVELRIPAAPGFGWSNDLDEAAKEKHDLAYGILFAAVSGLTDKLVFGSEAFEIRTHFSDDILIVRFKCYAIVEWEVRFTPKGAVECRADIHCSVTGTPAVWMAETWLEGVEKLLAMLQTETEAELKSAAERSEVFKACKIMADPT